jgi:hypothetical protein
MNKDRAAAKKRSAEAGARNLEEWKRKNPSGGRLSHGAYSKVVRKKYGDLRTREARALKAQIDSLIADLKPLTPAQKLIIARVPEKLLVLCQLSRFIETQGAKIIDERGNAIPCLSTYLRYSASLLRDLDLLYKKAEAQRA